MDISAGKPLVIINNYSSISSVGSLAEGTSNKPIVVKTEAVNDELHSKIDTKELSNDEVTQITDRLNKFMETINTDLRFEIHEKTNRVIVQVVNSKDQQVIKEFPPHELLDTLAAISDYVGVLLDKKA